MNKTVREENARREWICERVEYESHESHRRKLHKEVTQGSYTIVISPICGLYDSR